MELRLPKMYGFMRGCQRLEAVPKWIPDSRSSLTLTMGMGLSTPSREHSSPLCTGSWLGARAGVVKSAAAGAPR